MNKNEIKQKIILIILALTVITTVAILIITIFLNKGTIILHLKPPYTVIVENKKQIYCKKDLCKITLQSGNYNLIIKKDGYKEKVININLKIFETQEKQIKLELIPTITKLGQEKDLNYFKEKQEPTLAYLKTDKTTKKQYLYYKENNQEKLATTSIRIVKKYEIYPSITKNKKIAFIDNSYKTSSVYIIDLIKKQKSNLLQTNEIQDAKWLENNKLLIESINPETLKKQIQVLNTKNGLLFNTGVETTIKNAVQLNKDTVILLKNTKQEAQDNNNSISIEDALNKLDKQNQQQVNAVEIIKLNLKNNQLTTILTSTVGHSDKAKASKDKTSVIFLSNGIDYKVNIF